VSDVPEARLVHTEHGLVPEGDGWFVLNARDAVWEENDVEGSGVGFENPENRFPDIGINIVVLQPGQPNALYHGENEQEDFLVLEGECLFLVEGEERRLGRWDFAHCPHWTEHILVGAGDRPCIVLCVGGRRGKGVIYPVANIALKHDAGVTVESRDAKEAYAHIPPWRNRAYREGDLPDYSARR
jgi:uncharacterized cupin superfamily protein